MPLSQSGNVRRRENARIGQSYARQRQELLSRAKRRVKKLLVFVRNGTLGKMGTAESKIKSTLLGGDVCVCVCANRGLLH